MPLSWHIHPLANTQTPSACARVVILHSHADRLLPDANELRNFSDSHRLTNLLDGINDLSQHRRLLAELPDDQRARVRVFDVSFKHPCWQSRRLGVGSGEQQAGFKQLGD